MSPQPASNYYVPLDAGATAPKSSSPVSTEEVSASAVAAITVATGHHMLKIVRYSRLKETHGGVNNYGENRRIPSYIESSEFKVGGHTWKIRCYLHGNTMADVAGFVSLYLHHCSSDSSSSAAAAIAAGVPVLAEYEFALLRYQHGTTGPATVSHVVRSKGVKIHGGADSTWGVSRFISVEELEGSSWWPWSSKLLKNDCFAIRCTVTVVQEHTMKVMKAKAVEAHDMAGMGLLCKCDDELCKRHHARTERSLLERFAEFCYFICRGGPV